MTFADKLEELRKAATPYSPYLRKHEAVGEFLANNADAILELVRAADLVRRYPNLRSHIGSELDDRLRSALAKLNGEQT